MEGQLLLDVINLLHVEAVTADPFETTISRYSDKTAVV